MLIFNLGTPTNVTSQYSGALTTSSLTFTRNGASGIFYYKSIQIAAIVTGTYSFICNSTDETIGYLYNNTFDPTNPNLNLLTQDYGSGRDFQFQITFLLQTGVTYFLVVTTYAPGVTTDFFIIISGPAIVQLHDAPLTTGTTSTSSFQTTTSPVYSSK